MFMGCTNLNYINLRNFNETTISSEHYLDVFSIVPNNIVICLDPNSNIIKSTLANHKCPNFICTDNWYSIKKKNSK